MYQIGQHVKTIMSLELSTEYDIEETFYYEKGSTGIIARIGKNKFGNDLIYIKMDTNQKEVVVLIKEISLDYQYYREEKINTILNV